jgi:CHAT domain-containing protein
MSAHRGAPGAGPVDRRRARGGWPAAWSARLVRHLRDRLWHGPVALRQAALSALLVFGLAATEAASAAAPSTSDGLSAGALEAGIAWRRQGQLGLAIGSLREARDRAADPAQRSRAQAALGAALLQARHLEGAEAALREAYADLAGTDRAAVALDLGNLALLRGRPAAARARYEEVERLAEAALPPDPALRTAARLNLARTVAPPERLPRLAALARELEALPPSAARSAWQLQLAQQALRIGAPGTALAYPAATAATAEARARGDARTQAEGLDLQAQLYENQGRAAEALALTQSALGVLAAVPPAQAGDLPILLEWRQARVQRSLGRPEASLAAWQRAVRQVEALRQDIPIDDEAGNSSFRTLLEPVYLGLVEGLLGAADRAPPARQPGLLRQVVDTVELIRQSELQDYLGDRCDVDAVKGGTETVIPRGTAVLYPVVLDDRLELLLETAEGITRARSPVPARGVREAATLFADQLRASRRGYLDTARRLYDAVLRPLEPVFARQAIDTLVVVPDGALRLVAMGAFHDGQRYAIERFAIATATGMSMTSTATPAPRKAGRGNFLVAGLSAPGPVVDKLDRATVRRLLGPQAASMLPPEPPSRGVGADDTVPGDARTPPGGPTPPAPTEAPGPDPAADARTRALREALALPGVADEVEAITQVAPNRLMFNEDFTVEGFRRAAESGDYRIVHVASHGVFGGSADASYILAYDDLLTLDGLQSLLRSDRFRRNPIDLLSLSACETAEGDERSPLGISGAAIKARAKSVMGSLWPVSDEAAVKLMGEFYAGLLNKGLPKAQALRASQVDMLRSQDYAHPFFWAPFILIGNWL